MDNLVRFKAREIVDAAPENEGKIRVFQPRFAANATEAENKSSLVTLMDGKTCLACMIPRAFKFKLSAWVNANWASGGSND